MKVRIEHARGPAAHDATPLIRHLVRFGKRLRRRGIYTYTFPVMVDDAAVSAAVVVGRRVALIHNDGTIHPSLKPRCNVSGNLVTDRQALGAHRNRWHATFLNLAAESRRNGWLKAARLDLSIATQERKSCDD